MRAGRRIAIAAVAALSVGTGAPAATDAETAIGHLLDGWHRAASVADGAAYFAAFAPEGVFLGTADGERWDVAAFRAYAEPHFSQGRGWTYVPSDRHVTLAPGGRVAWFDERLDSEKYGVLRGTGVVRRVDGAWRIAQYNMTFLVPNERAGEVVELLRGPAD